MTELSKKTKLALLFAAGALLLLIDFLRDRVSQWQRPLRHPHACIDDPLHDRHQAAADKPLEVGLRLPHVDHAQVLYNAIGRNTRREHDKDVTGDEEAR